MKLYFCAGTSSFAVQLALAEAGLEVDLVRVDLKDEWLHDPQHSFYRVNPLGYVPVLVTDDGSFLREVPAILCFIADRWAANAAPSVGQIERYRLYEMLGFINSELHKPIGLLLNQMMSENGQLRTVARIERMLDWLERSVARSEFSLGQTLSVADFYLFTVLGWLSYINLDLVRWKALHAYYARLGSRSSVEALRLAENT